LLKKLCFAGVAVCVFAPVSVAHNDAVGIVKDRMLAMEEMETTFKATGKMFRGKRTFDAGRVEESAQIVLLHARKTLSMFPDTPESRGVHASDALDVVWVKWDEFKSLNDELIAAAEDLSSAVKAGKDQDELGILFRRAAKTCAQCHDQFRKE